jgi:hypothetical protein
MELCRTVKFVVLFEYGAVVGMVELAGMSGA